MSGPTAARRAALAVLRAVRRGELADRALAGRAAQLPQRDRAWLQELTYGTLRLRGRIDYLLERHVRRGLGSLDADVLDVLRLGAYQLLEMTSVPVYAAVSQSVELAKAAGASRASGLVNGVLHGLSRDETGPDSFPRLEADPVAHLSTWGSHPRWLVERWIAAYGARTAAAIVEQNNRRPELYIRPIGMAAADARARLAEAGVATETVGGAPDALRLGSEASVEQAFAVPSIVQDPAAGLVVRYADVREEDVILDVCAAPGGKAIGLAESAAYVAAADLSSDRLARVLENVRRVGGSRIGCVVADARHPPFRPADGVLLDVPCTGTGTLRRHADGRWRVTEKDLQTLVLLQRQIMEAAAPLVRPGGLLLYATCSLETEENEAQVEWFLGRFPEFVTVPSTTVRPDLLDERGRLKVLPPKLGVDGAFAARLRRSGG